MQREADDEQRAERGFAEREGRADGQALAEVVQADADRDEQREHRAVRATPRAFRARAPRSHCAERLEPEIRAARRGR